MHSLRFGLWTGHFAREYRCPPEGADSRCACAGGVGRGSPWRKNQPPAQQPRVQQGPGDANLPTEQRLPPACVGPTTQCPRPALCPLWRWGPDPPLLERSTGHLLSLHPQQPDDLPGGRGASPVPPPASIGVLSSPDTLRAGPPHPGAVLPSS